MAKAKRKQKPIRVAYMDAPPAEYLEKGDWERAGMAYRRTPVIETLRAAGKINQREFDALDYYRSQALQAEDDCAQESTLAPARVMGGGGSTCTGGRIPAQLLHATPALIETGRIEADLGKLLALTHAIAVDDISIAQWCIAKFGGREKRGPNGNVVSIVPACANKTAQFELISLRMAAGRISRAS